jgi:hypothetical protein
MFTAECLSPNLFAEYWLAIGVVQRLLLTRDEVVWKLAKHLSRGRTCDLPL